MVRVVGREEVCVGGGGHELALWHWWLQKDNEVISMLDGVFEQEGAGKRRVGRREEVLTGIGHIYVEACRTRGAKCRRLCGWWGRSGRWGAGGGG